MGRAKDIIIKPIDRKDADRIVKSIHYSGKVVRNSQLHFGVFLDGQCGGAIQLGPSLDKRKLIGLVDGTKWNEFIELNRMALADWLPVNSESRSLAVCMRLLRRHAPHLKWVVSFADGTQCGHGTIYQAAGFTLTAINESKNLCRLPNGEVIHKMTLESSPDSPRPELGGRSYYDVTDGRYNFSQYVAEVGGSVLAGHQLRYLYFLDRSYRGRLTVEEIPYSSVVEVGATMIRGHQQPISQPYNRCGSAKNQGRTG